MDFTAINMCLWSVSGQQMSEKSVLPFCFNSWKYALCDVTHLIQQCAPGYCFLMWKVQ